MYRVSYYYVEQYNASFHVYSQIGVILNDFFSVLFFFFLALQVCVQVLHETENKTSETSFGFLLSQNRD